MAWSLSLPAFAFAPTPLGTPTSDPGHCAAVKLVCDETVEHGYAPSEVWDWSKAQNADLLQRASVVNLDGADASIGRAYAEMMVAQIGCDAHVLDQRANYLDFTRQEDLLAHGAFVKTCASGVEGLLAINEALLPPTHLPNSSARLCSSASYEAEAARLAGIPRYAPIAGEHKICEAYAEGETPMEEGELNEALQEAERRYAALRASPQDEAACKLAFTTETATNAKRYAVMDHINCVAGTPQCDEAMTWLHELTKFTQLYVDHKGRHSADTSEIMWREVDPSAFTFSGGITDEKLDCTIGALRDFYAGFSAEAVAQGKLFLTRSGVGLTSLFRACAVPFIGGISGTTAQYLKQFAGTLGAENVTPKMLATLMAIMVVGGHHSLFETSVTVQHFLKHFTQLAAEPGTRLFAVGGLPVPPTGFFHEAVHLPFDHDGAGARCAHYDADTDTADFAHASEDSGPYIQFLRDYGLWLDATFE